ncbi:MULTISPECIES: flagellar assembly peptidoglycan hydrolase FlgJ [Dyella]|uniref:Peptidoglycan hydrolase FlgJ n=2 Tax=Dyella TaxID=231454 RepID=A0A4R0YH33_9GAMM|nr:MULTISPECIES: flagellar assembly peptidoglycan hydrolase FlgJ [Dyella]TBR37188.1 flagellar assembly peptidoglycan hydrolase FlgJ [Dyella terrae]TCI07722.1 flagellar assembly peptidoglycan hydrolase FlgJ [Dyella soli]
MAVGDVNLPALDNWTELSGFQKLRNDAQTDSKSALPAVAKQFEAIFTQMMLKSMRDASFGDGMGDSEAGDTYRDMFDQQLSLSLSNSGRGIGIAQMLVKQLGGKDAGITPSVGGNAALSDTLAQITRTAGKVAGKAASVLPGAGDAVSFVQSLAPHAQAAAEKLGVSVRALLAQAALETGWGKHLPSHGDGSTSNNLFGMKAGSSWDGEKVSVPTLEYENGVAVRKRDQFRAYDSPSESFSDYADVLANSPRYTAALGRGEDVRGFAHALVRGGYATDPAYANKLVAIANSPEMRQALDALKSGVSVPSQLP